MPAYSESFLGKPELNLSGGDKSIGFYYFLRLIGFSFLFELVIPAQLCCIKMFLINYVCFHNCSTTPIWSWISSVYPMYAVEIYGDNPLPYPTIYRIESIDPSSRVSGSNTDPTTDVDMSNYFVKKVSHCGVLEYSANEMAAFMPMWVFMSPIGKKYID